MSIRPMLSGVLFTMLCACSEHAVVPSVELGADPKPPVVTPAPVAVGLVDAAPVTPAPVTPVAAAPVAEPPAPPKSFADAMTAGKALAAKGDAANARVAFRAAAQLDKHRAEPYIELARSFIAGDERGNAITAAKKAVELAPQSTTAWNTMGRAELARKQYDAAVDAFQKAVELDRDNVWAWNNLGFAQLETKHYDAALVALAEATGRPTATGYMWNNLGTALEQLGRLDEAREAYEKGGTLGSVPAVASRKRLEGVKTIAAAQPRAETPEPEKAEAPALPDPTGGSAMEPGSAVAPAGSDATTAGPTTL